MHESAWTATARHADIVLPGTMTLEREDIGGSADRSADGRDAPHRRAARRRRATTTTSSADLAQRLGAREAFTEGRTSDQWLRTCTSQTRHALQDKGSPRRTSRTSGTRRTGCCRSSADDGGILRAFRDDPAGHPLPTPSGKMQVSSATIAGFGYADCPGHPAWLEPTDAPTPAHPLWLVANQPATRLHSQLDFGGHSDARSAGAARCCTMHPADAAARGIAEATSCACSTSAAPAWPAPRSVDR